IAPRTILLPLKIHQATNTKAAKRDSDGYCKHSKGNITDQLGLQHQRNKGDRQHQNRQQVIEAKQLPALCTCASWKDRRKQAYKQIITDPGKTANQLNQ